MANPKTTNDHLNESCLYFLSISIPYIYSISIGIAFAILSLLTIASNTILVYTLYKTKQLNTISNKLILAMNISDLCLGLFAFPFLAVVILRGNAFGICDLEIGSSYIMTFFGTFSFTIMNCISIDRYFRVTKLNRYNLYMKGFHMKIMIISSFSIACGTTLLINLHPSFLQQVFFSSASTFFVIVLILLYRPMLKRLQDHVSSLNSQKMNSSMPPGNNEPGISFQERRNQLSATKTVKFLLVTIIALYTPYHVMLTWWSYYRFLKKTEPGHGLSVVYSWSCLLVLSNAYVNSWIIIHGNTRSRRFVLTLLQQCRLANRVADEI